MEPIKSAAAARILKVTPETVCEWARGGIIPATKPGRDWLFYADQLEAHLREESEKNLSGPVVEKPKKTLSISQKRKFADRVLIGESLIKEPPPFELLPKIIRRDTLRYRFRRLATPKWANLVKIRDMYKLAAKMRREQKKVFHVDHVIPLQGKFVTGLHVEDNLQIIPGIDNFRKNNTFVCH